MVHLKDLTSLKELNLSNVEVGDNGLARLEGMTSLESRLMNRTAICSAHVSLVEEPRSALTALSNSLPERLTARMTPSLSMR